MNVEQAQAPEAAAAAVVTFWDVFFANAPDNWSPTTERGEALASNIRITLQYPVYIDDDHSTDAELDPNVYTCLRVRSEARAREFEAVGWCIGCVSEDQIVWGNVPVDATGGYATPFA